MEVEAPASPLAWLVSTFGTLPASACTTLLSFVRLIVDASTVVRAVPSFSRVCSVPAPVTTSSSRRSGSDTSVKSCVMEPGRSVICTDCGL